MKEAGIGDADLGLAIGADRVTVWRWSKRGGRPSGEYVDAILAFFSKRLARTIRYEDLFFPKRRSRKVAA